MESTKREGPGFFELLWTRPNFFLLWVSKTISRAGDKLTQVALSVYALELGQGSAVAVALVFMFSLAPHFLFGWALGVVVDRVDKKLAMVFCDVARGLLILSIPFVGRIEYVLFVSFLVATLSAMFAPALVAAVPDTVKPRELMGANSLVSLSNAAIDVLGYAMAGVVIMVAGVRLAFAIDFVSYIVSAAAVACISVRLAAPAAGERSFLPDLKEGFRYQFRTPVLNSLLIMVGLGCITFGAVNSLGIVAVDRLLKMPAASHGLLLSGQGVAMLVGSVLLGRVLSRRMHKAHMIAIGFLLLGISITAISLNRSFAVSMAAYFLLGLGNILFLVPTLTWVQEISPLEMRGRLLGIRNVIVNLALFISMGTAGLLADRVGVSVVLLVAGLATALCALGPRFLPGLWPGAGQADVEASG